MFDQCRDLRGALGAAALGVTDNEAVALQAHLEGCESCRAELAELRGVARALPLADLSHVRGALAEPSPELAGVVIDRITRERVAHRHRLRRRVAAIGGIAAALAAAVVAVVLLIPGASSPAPTRIALTSSVHGVSARATMRAREAGTEVTFRVEGLHDGDTYWLWLTGDDGKRIAAGTFRGTDTRTDLMMTSALPLRDVRRVWVTDAANDVVLDGWLSQTAQSS
ncbi:MAG TPA: anti-sigma factor [Acidimicrobiia bacterium]|nr:anti-sigma factor [Acidimicrobiia bacterium]